ncbi:MAG: methyltransferase domain-containing protein, partial [Patescibacteria group bacterium]
MDIIEALDTIFDFFPRHILTELKNEGFYRPILEGRVKEGAEIYDILERKHSSLQEADYAWLAQAIKPFLRTGSILQIGCGGGNLLKSLAESGFRPIYGIDRSQVMLETAASRLKGSADCFLVREKIESFDFSGLADINNVIINNFWGMVCEERSRRLLDGLKKCINGNSLLFIGPYEEKRMDSKKR